MPQYETLKRSTIDIPSGSTVSIKQVGKTDGYDGHCLRAFSYFPDRLPGIVDTVESINSIADLFPDVRQDSKAPTFLLTYGGKYFGLMKNLGLLEFDAKKIESNYHELYKVSDDFVDKRIAQASKDGYIDVAFGLRLRTPLLKNTILGNNKTPKEAESEARTAGNAIGQSWGLLNNRAANEFRGLTLASEHKLNILPIMWIHDAAYFLLRDDIDVVRWFNENYIKCMEWQDDPAIAHPIVGLGGNLELFYPSWADKFSIPNNADELTIREICKK